MRNAQILIQAYSQSPWRKQLQIVGLFSLFLVILTIILSLYLIISANAATTGRRIQALQYEITQIQQENSNLESQLAGLTSAARMEERAKEMGLQPATTGQILYLTVDGYVPRQPANLAPAPAPAVASAPGISPAFSQSLVDWAKDELHALDLGNLIDQVLER